MGVKALSGIEMEESSGKIDPERFVGRAKHLTLNHAWAKLIYSCFIENNRCCRQSPASGFRFQPTVEDGLCDQNHGRCDGNVCQQVGNGCSAESGASTKNRYC
jgi:hypothetical protein